MDTPIFVLCACTREWLSQKKMTQVENLLGGNFSGVNIWCGGNGGPLSGSNTPHQISTGTLFQVIESLCEEMRKPNIGYPQAILGE